MTYYSQCKQDQILDSTIFKGLRNGIFMDIGAHDGVSLNNTLFFEETRGWSGINVEPICSVYDKLCTRRPNCINVNVACTDYDYSSADFVLNLRNTEMLSGLAKDFDPRHHARVLRENKQNGGGETLLIKVLTRTVSSICSEHSITHINYLSIDVEGAEFSVIRGIDFSLLFIDVIAFEANYKDTAAPIVTYLESKGFVVFRRELDIFMIHKDSAYFKNIQV